MLNMPCVAKWNITIWALFLLIFVRASTESNRPKSWKEKDIRDMTDADLEHLLDQWEENEEPLEPDELPEHLRANPQIDLSKIDASKPDDILRMTKKGKGVMMFVDVDADVPIEQADVIMRIWQSSLQNNHIIAERYPTDARRSVFLFREGSQAVDAKEYLLQQPELSHVTLEGQTFYATHKQQSTMNSKTNTKNGKKIEL